MISIVMPYWERPEATRRSLRVYKEFYDPSDVEVILVDDGSPNYPAEEVKDEYAGCRVLTLPKKDRPLNPCVPINRGMEIASGDILGLSNPEVVHQQPALLDMVECIESDLDYVVAGAYCPEMNQWHAHPQIKKDADLPVAAGHFLAIFKRRLWKETGGFDESYRYGQGYDDTDFLMRLLEIGAPIKFTNHVVLHHKSGAVTKWNLPQNRARYIKKWFDGKAH